MLRHILGQLSRQDSLSLSMTCRSVRLSSMDFLFGFACLAVYGPHTVTKQELFMPITLRPYVQYVASNCLYLTLTKVALQHSHTL